MKLVGNVDGPGKNAISSGLFSNFDRQTLTMVGTSWGCWLFGEFRACGLHAQLVDVGVRPKNF